MNISRMQCAGCEPKSLAFEGRKKHSTAAKKIATGVAVVGAVAGGTYLVKSGKAKQLLDQIAASDTFKSVTKFVGDTARKVGEFFTSIPEKLSNLGSKIKDIIPKTTPKA